MSVTYEDTETWKSMLIKDVETICKKRQLNSLKEGLLGHIAYIISEIKKGKCHQKMFKYDLLTIGNDQLKEFNRHLPGGFYSHINKKVVNMNATKKHLKVGQCNWSEVSNRIEKFKEKLQKNGLKLSQECHEYLTTKQNAGYKQASHYVKGAADAGSMMVPGGSVTSGGDDQGPSQRPPTAQDKSCRTTGKKESLNVSVNSLNSKGTAEGQNATGRTSSGKNKNISTVDVKKPEEPDRQGSVLTGQDKNRQHQLEGQTQNQQSEIDRLKTEIARLKECEEKEKIQEEEIKHLRSTASNFEQENLQQKSEIDEQTGTIKYQSDQLKDKGKTIEKLEQQIKEMDRSHELTMHTKDEQYSNQEKEYRSRMQKMEESYMQTVQDKEKKLYEMNANNTKLKEKAKESISKLQDDVWERDVTIRELTKEKNELQTRYSQIASEKLNQNNPDIVDLSDPNRAMKLAERFGDIYNESWTDAYEALDNLKYQDKDSVGFLLYGLTSCFEYCTTMANSQLESLKNLLLYPDQNPGQQVKQAKGLEQPRLSSDSNAKLIALRRKVATGSVEMVKQSFPSWLIQSGRADKKLVEASKKYLFECAHMCWLMVLHDPPLVIRTDVKAGVKVDTNLYTTMSKGDIVEYLVWPPLYNGQSGGLLSKGVVEVKKVLTKKGK